MKIALCLHGNFNNRLSPTSGIDGSSYIKDVILDKYSDIKIDIFIHSWDLENETIIRSVYSGNIVNCSFEPQFNFNIVAEKSGIDRNFFNQPNNQSFRTCANSLSFFYSRKKSIDLKSEYENEHDFKYDCVIVSRFDLGQIDKYNGTHPYNVSEINFNPHYDLSYIYSAMWNQLNCGYADQWFYSNSQNINKISLIYDQSLDYFKSGSSYMHALSNWCDSNSNDEFSNELFLSNESKSKNRMNYLFKDAVNNHAIYKWFFIDSNIYNISRFV
jgi:hypothetical protein